MLSQLIQPYLFNPFNNNKIHLLFCNNTSKPPIPFMYDQKMLKAKELGNINYHHIQAAI